MKHVEKSLAKKQPSSSNTSTRAQASAQRTKAKTQTFRRTDRAQAHRSTDPCRLRRAYKTKQTERANTESQRHSSKQPTQNHAATTTCSRTDIRFQMLKVDKLFFEFISSSCLFFFAGRLSSTDLPSKALTHNPPNKGNVQRPPKLVIAGKRLTMPPMMNVWSKRAKCVIKETSWS